MIILRLSFLLSFLFCFSQAYHQIQLNLICDLPDAIKRDCGYSGITESVCLSRNCCFVPSGVQGITWCFFPGSPSPTVAPTLYPSEAPTFSQAPSFQPSKAPTVAPTISLAPTTFKPTYSPSAAPTQKVVDHSIQARKIVVAMIVVGLLIIFIFLFLCLSYYRIRREEQDKQEKAAPKKPAEETKESNYVSLYPNDQSVKVYNRRDLYMTTFADESQYDDDERNNPRPISWYEDRDHGFVN